MNNDKIKKINKTTWQKRKEKEWQKNADFWVQIIRKKLDPFRQRVTNKAILGSLPKEKNLKILDAGCGEGYMCRMLAKKGYKVFGVDSSKKLINSAKKLEERQKLGINYSVADFRKTKFPDSFFDIVLSHQTLIEIPDPEKAIKEFGRILKRKGIILALFLHPCFDFRFSDLKNGKFALNYFQRREIEKGKYLVGGILSPFPYFYIHLPLSQWINIFTRNKFLILNIKEPAPPLKLLKKDKWWKENFDKPRFLLIKAQKA